MHAPLTGPFVTESLTIQAFWQNRWHDVGQVMFRNARQGLLGPMQFFYTPAYVSHAEDARPGLFVVDERAVGCRVPVNYTDHFTERWLAPVLRDMIPQGYARRTLAQLWGMRDEGPALDYQLLRRACVAPIGNLRVKEAALSFEEKRGKQRPLALTRKEVSHYHADLVAHLCAEGFPVEAALGAGGDAPKALLVEDCAGRFYIDGTLDEDKIARHWLVKFPRGKRLAVDQDILRAEGIFYQALSSLGLDTIHGAELVEGDQPTLWLPRFDRETGDKGLQRHGVESVYSLMGMLGNGARVTHPGAMEALTGAVTASRDEVLVEYVFRDILNKTIGNTDNHGRNTAVIKRLGNVELAPAYDLAPMAMDPDGIARATVWPQNVEALGVRRYLAVLSREASDPDGAMAQLKQMLMNLSGLKSHVMAMDLPPSVQNCPRVQLDFPAQVLKLL